MGGDSVILGFLVVKFLFGGFKNKRKLIREQFGGGFFSYFFIGNFHPGR